MRALGIGSLFLLLACAGPRLPLPAPTEFALRIKGEFAGDTLVLGAVNRTPVPLFFRLGSTRPRYQKLVPDSVYAIAASGVRTLRFGPVPASDRSAIGGTMTMRPLLDTLKVVPDTTVRYQYPFTAGRSYAVMQAYNGTFSHQSPAARYALDLAIPEGDTICAARAGIVIEIRSGNTLQGPDLRYEPYGNYLTLYHADGVITQYVHLQKDGVLVGIGASVRAGQPIGIAGFTGFTTQPHLHFNVCIGLGKQRRSIPVRFIDREGKALRTGDTVSRAEQ